MEGKRRKGMEPRIEECRGKRRKGIKGRKDEY